jgi:catechol 2,3-dioxygenase-like lactoylglutathione lyase family enzyme
MKPRFTILTLGVDNLERAYKFYHEGLGLPSKGIIGKEFEHGAVAFFELANGMQLAIYERANLAWDSGLPVQPASSTEFSIGHFVKDQETVNEVMEQARTAGAKIVKPAQKTFWGGYAGYFQDPDGHLWEVVFNPALIPED